MVFFTSKGSYIWLILLKIKLPRKHEWTELIGGVQFTFTTNHLPMGISHFYCTQDQRFTHIESVPVPCPSPPTGFKNPIHTSRGVEIASEEIARFFIIIWSFVSPGLSARACSKLINSGHIKMLCDAAAFWFYSNIATHHTITGHIYLCNHIWTAITQMMRR